MQLYARPGCFRAQKVLVAAQYANAKVSVNTKATAAELKGKAAADRLPLLETDKGCLFESNAIMRFVAAGNKQLCGADAFEAAKIDGWMDFAANEVDVPATMVTGPIIGTHENYPDVTAQALKDLKAALTVLENHLKLETYLVGRAISLADIAVAAALVLPMRMVLDDKVRKSFTCVTRWFTTCVNQTEFLKVIGPVTLVKKAVQPKAPAKSSAKAAAKEEAPKEAAKPAEPVKEEPQDAIAKVNALPKSSLVLDAWKRQYSNSSNLYDAMPWLWENYDAAGYTILRSKYKFNEENKILFQVSNLCGGFVQRCDAVRKFAFGVMNIIGAEAGPMEIVGMWLVRGPDEKIILENNPDAEYHEWTKLDISKEEDKKEIADMWCAEEEVYGKKILDSKVFK